MKFIDLFCGIGGFHKALQRCGHTCVYASDSCPHARMAYENNFNMDTGGDIRDIDPQDIPTHDILCAGFPCQPYSTSGARKGLADDRGAVFYDMLKIIYHHTPRILLLENVPNLLKSNDGSDIAEIESGLRQGGYTVYKCILNASHYGIPQSRKRLYFVCIHKSYNATFTIPKPTYERVVLSDILLPNEQCEHLIVKRTDIKWVDDTSEKYGLVSHKVAYMGSGGQGQCIFGTDACAPTITAKHAGRTFICKTKQVGSIGKGRQGERIYSTDGHACTQMALAGGGGAKTGLYAVDGSVRTLHIDEVKQVMGFPVSHYVTGGGIGFKQLGNAVIPKMVELLIKGIKETE